MVEFKEISYKRFGRCIAAYDGTAELFVTLDIGPRIIRFAPQGGENIFKENENFDLSEKKEDFKPFGSLGCWHNFGGHRLWTSPEIMPRTYFPDNVPCSCETDGDALTLTQIPQEYTKTAMSLKIEFLGGGEVKITHFVKNIGAWDIKLAPWAITVMDKGGTEIIPLRTDGPKLLPNRNISLWTYTRLSDKRLKMLDKYILLSQSCAPKFKIGINNASGFAAYIKGSDMFVKYFDYDDKAEYPDNGCNFETYTDENILEIESLAPLKNLAPGETVKHIERWKIISGVALPDETDDSIDEFVNKYI